MKNPDFLKIKKYDADRYYGKDKNIMILLGISIALSAILFLVGVLAGLGVFGMGTSFFSWMDFMVFGLLTSVGPVGFYNHTKAKKKKLIEEQLPDFLREISSATSSGMTIFDAIITSSKGDHGKLTSELEMMASQLSWGISVNEALDNFAKRVNTPSVKRIVVTINKALDIGGNTASVFEAAAREIDQVKLVEEQRKAEMTMYAMVIFISFFVFLAVILIINNTIFAAIYDLDLTQAQANIQTSGGLSGLKPPDPEIMKNTFFLFIVVQSMGGGLLGGFMSDGKLSSGVRYAFALILVSFFVFKFMM